jgi:hypothetical protein
MDTNILAVLIQEGSKIASQYLRNRTPQAPPTTIDSVEKYIQDSEMRLLPYAEPTTAPPQPVNPLVNQQVAPTQALQINVNQQEQPYVPKATAIATGCIPCMPPDSLVWSNPGTKEISKLTIGDKVLDRDGKYTKILNISSRPYNGDLIVITVPGQNTPILLTPNHRVLAIKGITCKRNRGATLCFPKESCGDCPHQYSPDKAEFVEAGQLSTHGKRNSWSRHILLQPVLKGKQDNLILNTAMIANVHPRYIRTKIKESVIVDNDFLKLAGFYLAEGSVNIQQRGDLLKFSFGKSEQILANETQELLYRVFGVRAKIKKEATSLQTYISSVILGHFFINYFGTGAAEKQIPQEILTLPPEKQSILLYGFWLGDGAWLTSYKRNCLAASTISPNLAFGIRTILNRLGIIHHFGAHVTRESRIGERKIKSGTPQFTIQINSNGANKLNRLWGITKEYRFVQSSQSGIDKDFVYLPIKKIDKVHYEGPVMNLETESHTYCANGIAVSNCAMGHFGTCSGILSESIRFSRSPEGLASPEVIDRVNMCMDELNAMERVDLRPEMTVQLTGWEKDLANKALSESRNLRHMLEGLKSIDELEKASAMTQTTRKEIGREWFQKKLSTMSDTDKDEIKRRVMAKIEEMAATEET